MLKVDVTKIYETLLSIPGMNDQVKIVLNLARKNVFLLSKVIERDLSVKDPDDKSNVLEVVSKEVLSELQSFPAELLVKAGLAEMNQKLQTL